MSKSRGLIGAIALLLAVANPGCSRDKAAPIPNKTVAVAVPVRVAAAHKRKPKHKHKRRKAALSPETVFHVAYRPVKASADALACRGCNVILISIDTLRADHLHGYGYKRDTSPNLDRFGRESLVFENAISQSAWTAPSHASMFTGLLPREHGVMLYPSPGKLPSTLPTLASRLKKLGYRTASWNGGGWVKAVGLDTGFDVFKTLGRGFRPNLPAARQWLSKNGKRPFFLFLHGFDVHRPFVHDELNRFHPKVELNMKRFCMNGKHHAVLRGRELEYVVAQYDAGIIAADRALGSFFKFLQDEQLYKNTIVIVTADHGDEFFDHGDCDHVHSVYRELVHVPLMVHLPSQRHGRVREQVAASISLVPTVLAMLGKPQGVNQAFDLRPVVEKTGHHPTIISETGHNSRRQKGAPLVLDYYKAAVTTAGWKLIYNMSHEQESQELYATSERIAEQHDKITTQALRVPELMNALFPPSGKPFSPLKSTGDVDIDDKTARTLRALGYVQ